MKKSDYLILLGVALSAGAGLGVLSERRQPVKGAALGAAAGIIAGAVAAGFYDYISADKVPYYSNASSLYEEVDTI